MQLTAPTLALWNSDCLNGLRSADGDSKLCSRRASSRDRFRTARSDSSAATGRYIVRVIVVLCFSFRNGTKRS